MLFFALSQLMMEISASLALKWSIMFTHQSLPAAVGTMFDESAMAEPDQ